MDGVKDSRINKDKIMTTEVISTLVGGFIGLFLVPIPILVILIVLKKILIDP